MRSCAAGVYKTTLMWYGSLMDPITYRGYRIVAAIGGGVAIMHANEALDFQDDTRDAREVIDGWLDAR